MLHATTACTFSTSQLPKWSEHVIFFNVFNMLTLIVLRATTVCNFSPLICPAGSARRFSEPTFRPCRATNHWRNTVFRDFPNFSRTWIFCLWRLSLFDLLSSSLLFSDSSNLCFSYVHIVGSLTSKLPSNIDIPYIYISSIAPSQRASPMPNLSRRAPESPPCEHCKA